MKLVVALLCGITAALLSPSPASACQDVPASRPAASVHLRLDEAVGAALTNAPALAAADAQQRAARWKERAIARSRWGQVDAVALYSRYQDDQLLRPMAIQLFGPGGFAALPWDRDQFHYGLTFQVPLYLGGRLSATVDVARLQADQAALLLEGSRWEVRANVTSLYTAAQALEVVIRALDQNLAALDATRLKVVLMVDQGRRPGLDLLKLDEEMADAQARRAGLVADNTRVRSLVLALAGRDPWLTLEVDPLPPGEPQLTHGGSELEALVRDSSPIRRGELATAQAEAGVRVARAAMRPTVSARANLMQNYGVSMGDQLGTWDVSVALSVPLFNGGARSAELASARETERAARQAALKVRLDREAQVVDALARFEASRQAVVAARARIASAAEAARIEQIRYDTGAGTVDDLLRARAHELAAASALAQARGDQFATAARINAIVEKEVVQ
ncbi:MAG: TolC family protein [Acidobacteria bacterium]|nr:TolC family protein [Acidobacteriota bacterium]